MNILSPMINLYIMNTLNNMNIVNPMDMVFNMNNMFKMNTVNIVNNMNHMNIMNNMFIFKKIFKFFYTLSRCRETKFLMYSLNSVPSMIVISDASPMTNRPTPSMARTSSSKI